MTPELLPVVTRNSKKIKPSTATGNSEKNKQRKAAPSPRHSRTKKPPTVTGYHWRNDGAGFELRKTVYDGEKRRQPYVAHLSKAAFAEMKTAHKGAALDDAIARWIAERDG